MSWKRERSAFAVAGMHHKRLTMRAFLIRLQKSSSNAVAEREELRKSSRAGGRSTEGRSKKSKGGRKNKEAIFVARGVYEVVRKVSRLRKKEE
jgi:hypothetical protein